MSTIVTHAIMVSAALLAAALIAATGHEAWEAILIFAFLCLL